MGSWRRFVGLIAIALALPATLLILFGGTHFRTGALTTAEYQNRVTAMAVAQAMQEVFDGIAAYVNSYASRVVLARSLEYEGPREALEQLEEMVKGNNKLARVLLVRTNGSLFLAHPIETNILSKNFRNEDWFVGAAAKEGVYVSRIHRRLGDANEDIVAVATRVKNADQNVVGYLMAQVTVEDIREWLDAVRPTAAGRVTLVDQAGFALGKRNSRLLTEVQRADLNQRFSAPTGRLRGPDPLGIGDTLVSWIRLQSLGWIILVTQPTDAALAPVKQMLRNVVGFSVLALAITICLGYVSFQALNRYEIARAAQQEQLRAQAQELRRSNSELEQFAYVASHDLQEPLRMVSNYCQLLERRYKGQLSGDADEFIKFAVDGSLRMQNLIDDLLAYSRVGSKGGEFKPTDMNAVCATAIQNLEVAIQESAAIVAQDPLPIVNGDQKQLVQLMQNLIANGVKFHGENRPEVYVTAASHEREWLFSVRDNGIGIHPEFSDKVFVIFHRLHGKHKYDGTGIGLAICKKVVERHNGRIWVESRIGQGATFYFTLPLLEEEPDPEV